MKDIDLFEIVERHPNRVSGAWVFRGTRVPVAALFENLKDGASIDQFIEWFPGVTRAQVESLLELAVVLLSTSWPRIQRHTNEIENAIENIAPGAYLEIEISG